MLNPRWGARECFVRWRRAESTGKGGLGWQDHKILDSALFTSRRRSSRKADRRDLPLYGVEGCPKGSGKTKESTGRGDRPEAGSGSEACSERAGAYHEYSV